MTATQVTSHDRVVLPLAGGYSSINTFSVQSRAPDRGKMVELDCVGVRSKPFSF